MLQLCCFTGIIGDIDLPLALASRSIGLQLNSKELRMPENNAVDRQSQLGM